MQHYDRTLTMLLTILGEGVKQKVNLDEKEGRWDEAKREIVTFNNPVHMMEIFKILNVK